MADFHNNSNADLTKRFGIIDYVVFGAMLVISAIIGMYYASAGGKQKTTNEFLLGSKSLRVFPVSVSLLASFISAIALLGFPAETYEYGLEFGLIKCVSFPIGIAIAAALFIPVFYDLGMTSTYEYLERRFSPSVRTLGAFIFILNMLFFMSVVLYAPALALSQVTGIHIWFSVLSTGAICTFYTSIGGIKAVVWTDVFQGLLMILAMLVIVVKGIYDVGGIKKIYEINKERDRLDVFVFDADPLRRHSIYSLSIGSVVSGICVYGFSQAMVQRYLTLPTVKKAKQALWLVMPMKVFIVGLCCAVGLIIFANYENCDPLVTKRVMAPDQIYPLFVMDSLGFIPGFPGLFVAAVFSGALSSLSTGLNSLAAVTLHDFIKKFLVKDIKESTATTVSKALAIGYGIISVALVVVAQQMGNVLSAAIKVGGLLGSPIAGLFLLGLLVPAANKYGALCGGLSGLATTMWIGIGSMLHKSYTPKKIVSVEGCIDLYTNITKLPFDESTFVNLYKSSDRILKNNDIFPVYRISYQYYGVVGIAVTVTVGIIVSLLTGSSKWEKLESNLFISCVARRIRRYQEKQKDVQVMEMKKGGPNAKDGNYTVRL